ncbi:Glutathione peroxidase [Ignavibacterium album JCM 16511]|uniref:Glutathione peroxidase n=1 Tax=Ignavibacterium album (strain DSM 19864 / JCM 16511 / NBRC 101810 / Mat9-16) TaxID=945713 RepID=I0ANK4_IGNAJ|nr:glutathione peroxidase [Ignavibacterium album]AFH50561.1 Glutathione peroxidase [Ignavibacterium album JCM 16511]
MKAFIAVLSIFIMLVSPAQSQNQKGVKVKDNVLSVKVKDIDGKEVNLSDYKDKVLLIVNVASFCGYTKQYAGLQDLYETYKDKGFEILAFPCNQFGNQEPGSNEEIKNFCSSKYNVTFRLFDKIDVNGNNKSPLYAILTDNPVTGKGDIKWNFEKFVVGKNGKIIARFPSSVEPTSEKIVSLIEKELKK